MSIWVLRILAILSIYYIPFVPLSSHLSLHFPPGYDDALEYEDLQWPHVLRLKLFTVTSTSVNAKIARIFPNVRELRVVGLEHREIQVSRTPFCEDWPQLDYVDGPMPALYSLGLALRIRELRVPSLTHSEPKQPIVGCIRRTDAFLDLVRVANPETLSFAVDLRSRLADARFFHALANAAPSLEFLAISIIFSAKLVHDLVSIIQSIFVLI
jgi:hypothetical protein